MRDTYLSPGTLGALNGMYDTLARFAGKFRPLHPEWFNLTLRSMSKATAIGTQSSRGYLYDMVRHSKAADRAGAHMEALRQAGLPPLPGWEKACDGKVERTVPLKLFAQALAAAVSKDPQDCELLHFIGCNSGSSSSDIQSCSEDILQHQADRAARQIDADGSGHLSDSELEAWLQAKAGTSPCVTTVVI